MQLESFGEAMKEGEEFSTGSTNLHTMSSRYTSSPTTYIWLLKPKEQFRHVNLQLKHQNHGKRINQGHISNYENRQWEIDV